MPVSVVLRISTGNSGNESSSDLRTFGPDGQETLTALASVVDYEDTETTF
jgi:hypothetical protein